MNEKQFSGKVALVTGATSGIGQVGRLVSTVSARRRPGSVGVLVEAGADLPGAAVGDLDLDVFFAGGERRVQPCLLPFGEVLLAGAEDVPDR